MRNTFNGRRKSDPPPGGGSGFGQFTQGDRVTSVAQVQLGDILLTHSRQFNADNVMKVVGMGDLPSGTPRDLFYGQFVDPDDVSKPRIWSNGQIAVWGFMIAVDDDEQGCVLTNDYWRAIPPQGGSSEHRSGAVAVGQS